MTAIEYMEKQIQKHRQNYVRELARGVSKEMLDNIKLKISYYETAIESMRWTLISDRLPTKEDANNDGRVLVCSKGVGVIEDMEWDHVDRFKDLIRCWMPIPAPPMEDE